MPKTPPPPADTLADLILNATAPSPEWEVAHCGFVLTARDIMRALEGGPAACGRAECRQTGTCRNEARDRLCAKKLSPAAENSVRLMMFFALRLDPQDVLDFYFGAELFAAHHCPGPAGFDAETRAKLWPGAH